MDIQVLASGSRGNCYRISDGNTPLLLECGIRIKEIQQKLGFRLSEIAGCLISHEHLDHAKAIRDLTKAGMDCYMSQGTADALGISGHRVRIIKALQQISIGTWVILPFDTVHDAAEPLGFLLANRGGEKLLFATDTAYIRYKFKGLTHIMIEANYQTNILNENVGFACYLLHSLPASRAFFMHSTPPSLEARAQSPNATAISAQKVA